MVSLSEVLANAANVCDSSDSDDKHTSDGGSYDSEKEATDKHIRVSNILQEELKKAQSNLTHARRRGQVRSHHNIGQMLKHPWKSGPLSSRIKYLLESEGFERILGMVIVGQLVVIVQETDARAVIRTGTGNTETAEQQLEICSLINKAFLMIYIMECILRLVILRSQFASSVWNVLDVILVASDLAGMALQVIVDTSVLRGLRMIRLLRLSRTFIAFRELHALVCGLTHCMKTLFWAFGLIFLTLTVWSIIAVEYINPLMEPIDHGTCSWCPTAFSSVLYSNLTFFQIVSGDGWSTLSRPIIETHPWTAIVFVSVIIIVVFGFLNLVIAAIVDTASQARDADVQQMSKHAAQHRDEGWQVFRNLCTELDMDGSGGIGIDELRDGLMSKPKLREYFSIMGIEDDDIDELFKILDQDDAGDLTYKEFHNHLYKMKTLEVKTHLYYVTRYVYRMQRNMSIHSEMLSEIRENLHKMNVERRRASAATPSPVSKKSVAEMQMQSTQMQLHMAQMTQLSQQMAAVASTAMWSPPPVAQERQSQASVATASKLLNALPDTSATAWHQVAGAVANTTPINANGFAPQRLDCKQTLAVPDGAFKPKACDAPLDKAILPKPASRWLEAEEACANERDILIQLVSGSGGDSAPQDAAKPAQQNEQQLSAWHSAPKPKQISASVQSV